MAKDLVRTRNNITKFYKMRTELQAVSLRVQVQRAVRKSYESLDTEIHASYG